MQRIVPNVKTIPHSNECECLLGVVSELGLVGLEHTPHFGFVQLVELCHIFVFGRFHLLDGDRFPVHHGQFSAEREVGEEATPENDQG